jgi:hypothetical protein
MRARKLQQRGLLLLSLLIGIRAANAQCQGKSGFALQACLVAANASGASNAGAPPAELNSKAPALTTGIADLIHLDSLPPTVEPSGFASLLKLDRTDDGSFILKTGIFEAYVQSYSLEPNDCANRAAGFYAAPIKGRRAEVIAAVLKQAELHPDVPQGDIQPLLWAIVSGADLEKMPAPVQHTAARILPQDLLAQLRGPVQAQAAEKALMSWLNQRVHNPAAKQSAAIAGKWSGGNSQAVGSQAGGLGEPVLRGTWAQMAGGWFVRYLPEGCAKTKVQVIVPDTATAQSTSPLLFDPTQFLAVHTQAPAMRLGLTLRQVK